MSTPYSPSPGLGIAAGIAQGAENFMSSYQQAKQNAVAQQQQQQEFAMKQQMYGLQMQKLQQEVNPVNVDFAKLAMIRNGIAAGTVPEELGTWAMKKAYENIQTPTQAAYASQLMNKHIATQGVQSQGGVAANLPANPSAAPAVPMARSYGMSGPAPVINQDTFQAPSAPNAPQADPGVDAQDDSGAPQSMPQAAPGTPQARFGLSPAGQLTQNLNAPTSKPGVVSLNPAERQILDKMYGLDAAMQTRMIGAGVQLSQQQMQDKINQERLAAADRLEIQRQSQQQLLEHQKALDAIDLNRVNNDSRAAIEREKTAVQIQLQQLNAQKAAELEKMRQEAENSRAALAANTKLQYGKTMANARSGGPVDPNADEKASILTAIKNAQNNLQKLNNDKYNIMEPPTLRQQKRDFAEQQVNDAYAAYQKLTGKPYSGDNRRAPAPQAASSQTAPPAGGPPAIPELKPIPTSQAKTAPIGSILINPQGAKFKKVGPDHFIPN